MEIYTSETEYLEAEIKRLHEVNQELLEALYVAIPFVEDATEDYTYNTSKVKGSLKKIRAAIAKAEGGAA